MKPNMDTINHNIIMGLKEAMRTENDGHHFYLMAAKNVQDPKGQKVFESLAKEELAHLRFLTLQYRSFSTSGKLDEKAVLGPRVEFDETNPIFSDNIRSRIADAHFEMSVLSIGIQIEINSERYYRQQSEAVQHPEVKAFYTKLAEWESSHYHYLLRQQDALKEDYWASGNFAPF